MLRAPFCTWKIYIVSFKSTTFLIEHIIGIRSLYNDVAPYADITDERLHWLDLTFRNYINDVQQSSTSAGIQGLSRETANALNLLQKTLVFVLNFFLS
jgi:hypothetical protein